MTYIGNNEIISANAEVSGDFVTMHNQRFYKISNVHQMRPFFMSIVSHSDHWMFIASNGGISAGRKDENSALFPYYTDDKITDGVVNTGSVSIFRVALGGKEYLWEPFSDKYYGVYDISRNLYKSTVGNWIIFEEVNSNLNLSFRYSWQFSEKYGFIRKSEIKNLGENSVEVQFLDGIRNIMPYGVSSHLQNIRSNLANAYKRSELEKNSKLGIFSLTSMIVDKAEPSEALKATIAWSLGLKEKEILLSDRQLDTFREGNNVIEDSDVKATPGAYITHSQGTLKGGEEKNWWISADVNMDYSSIAQLSQQLNDEATLINEINEDISAGSKELKGLVAMADGLQSTGDTMSVARHYSNVLYNIMRGGIFDDQYLVFKEDLLNYLKTSRKDILRSHSSFIHDLPDTFLYGELLEKARSTGNRDVLRLAYEYLPLSFSRRHGDPSRPWNQFTIEGKNEKGKRNKNYEGNWRDIFQNWEALGLAFPDFIPSMITKFVNASTIDGYNPYRITREGIDWEVIEPDDPWSYIGYWGDHQIIYLLKLLEICHNHDPTVLSGFMEQSNFVFANVPYRIRSYEMTLADPQDTIDFDHELENTVHNRVEEIGSDGKLLMVDRDILHVNLLEKLLLTYLTKLYNFIPDGGIWLNTQRPEWNDANNALVGNGLSVVTLAYMYRFGKFFRELVGEGDVEISSSLAQLLSSCLAVLEKHQDKLSGTFTPTARREFMDEMGQAGENYRNQVYKLEAIEKTEVGKKDILDLIDNSLRYFESSLRNNKREDGLFHAYNLLEIKEGKAEIGHLYEMLEGQVAVLSAGLLDGAEVLDLLDNLKASKIYREDQYSYMLYPNRELPGFLEKNCIPDILLAKSKLANQMLESGDTRILDKDIHGNVHFNGDFHNNEDLKEALEMVKGDYPGSVEKESGLFLEVFEEVFNHSAFTGRSGTFYGYEGLGSIYWHMVSKLLLAVQENLQWIGSEDQHFPKIVDHYYEIRAGIGINKSPELYGAFPLDPYSHTPWGKGAQQPGMTGQVKEDIISRWSELGIAVSDGQISFNPTFLNPSEFLESERKFHFMDQKGNWKSLDLLKGQLAFTYCQVPIIFERSDTRKISVEGSSGKELEFMGFTIPQDVSSKILKRTGDVEFIRVYI